MPWAFAAAGLARAALAPQRSWAAWLLAPGLACLLLAAAGWWWPERRPVPRLVAMPAYFVAGVAAALVAWMKALSGELNPVWEPTRREEPEAGRRQDPYRP